VQGGRGSNQTTSFTLLPSLFPPPFLTITPPPPSPPPTSPLSPGYPGAKKGFTRGPTSATASTIFPLSPLFLFPGTPLSFSVRRDSHAANTDERRGTRRSAFLLFLCIYVDKKEREGVELLFSLPSPPSRGTLLP